MTIKNPPPRTKSVYPLSLRWFHWITAICAILTVIAGIAMVNIESGYLQNNLFDFHRSMGFFLLVLTAVRLLFRQFMKVPPLPDFVPMWQRILAGATQTLMYGILIITPIIGWYATSAYGASIKVFNLFTLPALTTQNRGLSEVLFTFHTGLGIVFVCAIVLHILGAFYHLLFLHDGIFQRMWGRKAEDK
ncbi:cytochrome b [Rhodobacteraceae bacterium RKSG542]|uniref:cytochrome b n=1 Tax=Pseudovibrio flavus TaxID=2529854 RepID=UPI0012BC7F83|nr:cytochrome b [Pseudovibrio flavus]MTI17704.1 cytochrome b [Pseudovibrio flavus]